jgi:hypothetical protein
MFCQLTLGGLPPMQPMANIQAPQHIAVSRNAGKFVFATMGSKMELLIYLGKSVETGCFPIAFQCVDDVEFADEGRCKEGGYKSDKYADTDEQQLVFHIGGLLLAEGEQGIPRAAMVAKKTGSNIFILASYAIWGYT